MASGSDDSLNVQDNIENNGRYSASIGEFSDIWKRESSVSGGTKEVTLEILRGAPACNHEVIDSFKKRLHSAGVYRVDGTIGLDLEITRTADHPFGYGPQVDLVQGLYRTPSGRFAQAIAKLLRGSPHTIDDDERRQILKAVEDHVLFWMCLKHDNLVPLLGLTHTLGFLPAIITPCYRHGNVRDFITSHPAITAADKVKLILQIAEALVFLHELGPDIHHGSICATNILIDDEENTRLSDTGLAALLSSDRPRLWRWWPCSTIIRQWRDDEPFQPTQALDVYAFGMTIIEICTGGVPFPELPDHSSTVVRISRYGLPTRERPPSMTAELWSIVIACCEERERLRPTMSAVMKDIKGYVAL